jgi:hypothetical protein
MAIGASRAAEVERRRAEHGQFAATLAARTGRSVQASKKPTEPVIAVAQRIRTNPKPSNKPKEPPVSAYPTSVMNVHAAQERSMAMNFFAG